MPDDAPHFDDQGRLIAPKYNDVYFSAEDGLAETRHVFLEGNRLAERFAAMIDGGVFTIGETGFGTGLNFLAAWQLFEQHAPADARLNFVSVEANPLDAETIRQALSAWPELQDLREQLLLSWSPTNKAISHHGFSEGRVRLKLLVGDVVEMLVRLNCSTQAWFLDGFAPSRNPDMWSDDVFKAVARCTPFTGTFATYTSAGFVRRGLQAAGFQIEKKPGYGRKREMIVGQRMSHPRRRRGRVDNIVVIGGSLAGAFVARSLSTPRRHVTVIERQHLVNGELPSLMPRQAVLQPKINDRDDQTGRMLREGYKIVMDDLVEREWQSQGRFPQIGWRQCGTFQAAFDERSERRLRRFVEQFGGAGLCKWIDADQTGEELGIEIKTGGVVIEQAGVLRPAGLCAALLDRQGVTVRDGVGVASLERTSGGWRVVLEDGASVEAGVVVVANAFDASRFEQTRHLPLCQVRGQVTLLRAIDEQGRLASLKRALFYGGYVTPCFDGVQTLGASFVRDDGGDEWRDSEHADNCEKLARILPGEALRIRSIPSPSGWVGHRTTTQTGRAICEQIDTGLYVSLGHGSHGIASAAYSAWQLHEMFVHEPWLATA